MILDVGAKVKFTSERERYTVQASDERYAICTRPYNLKKTVFYTINDKEVQLLRGYSANEAYMGVTGVPYYQPLNSLSDRATNRFIKALTLQAAEAEQEAAA